MRPCAGFVSFVIVRLSALLDPASMNTNFGRLSEDGGDGQGRVARARGRVGFAAGSNRERRELMVGSYGELMESKDGGITVYLWQADYE